LQRWLALSLRIPDMKPSRTKKILRVLVILILLFVILLFAVPSIFDSILIYFGARPSFL
jgi:hypothetical protein